MGKVGRRHSGKKRMGSSNDKGVDSKRRKKMRGKCRERRETGRKEGREEVEEKEGEDDRERTDAVE